ncbi:histidine phosphatase family protein [Candidatus Protofrankia californiensis]|uniref:histidine phosphatase family protein n=1 Tax=Candidatus Protofrankia californiensis TaxID=1839754 RepID=UPI0013E9CB93|nr:histidine phosphatase family protein [Candidatus Protofrankia californiensis]
MVWLVRHGQSESNAGAPCALPGESPLTTTGWAQARLVATAMTEQPTMIVTSRYLRARQTAIPATQRFPAAPLTEWPVEEFTYLGSLHGRLMTNEERRPWARAYWTAADPYAVQSPHSESFADMIARADAFVRRVRELPAGFFLVCTHGVFMTAVAWTLSESRSHAVMDMRAFLDFQKSLRITNGSIIRLNPWSRMTVTARDTAVDHLPAHLVTR